MSQTSLTGSSGPLLGSCAGLEGSLTHVTSLVEFEHHSMADTIRNENEEKKIKVKAPVTAKKNKQHQTSNCDISVTSAAAELKFLLCVDLVQISLL